MEPRVSNHETSGRWTTLGDEKTRASVVAALETLLVSDRLVLLAGLGTSLCVTDDTGARVAPTMTDLWARVQESDPDGLALAIERVGMGASDQNVELLLSRCLAAQHLRYDEELEKFIERAEGAISEACDFVQGVTQVDLHTTFLRKMSRRPPGVDRFRLFTTNYDLVFEYAASAAGLVSFDGFSHTFPRLFDPVQFEHDLVRRRAADGSDVEFVPGVHYLYKLHGSIDWTRTADGVTKSIGGSSSASTAPGRLRDSGPCLIFPRENKFQLSYESPFFDLLAAFQSCVRADNVGLLVVGFGFADTHIVRPILAALRSNPSLTAVFVDPRAESAPPERFEPVRRLVEQGDPRVTLLAMSFEELVPLMPNLQPETHLELQMRRVGSAGLR